MVEYQALLGWERAAHGVYGAVAATSVREAGRGTFVLAVELLEDGDDAHHKRDPVQRLTALAARETVNVDLQPDSEHCLRGA